MFWLYSGGQRIASETMFNSFNQQNSLQTIVFMMFREEIEEEMTGRTKHRAIYG